MRLRLILMAIFTQIFAGCAISDPPSTAEISRANELVDQGVLWLESGELERAEAAFKVASEIALLPQSVDGLGCIAFLRGDLEAAERYFMRAFNLDPNYAHVLGNLALLYEARGESGRAEQIYRAAVNRDPGTFKLRNNFAVFLKERIGADNEARTELLKGQALAPHPLIEENLILIPQ